MKSVPTTCLATYGFSEASSDGFRGVSEGSETLPFLKRRLRNVCMIRFESYGGFRGVSEGSETFLFLKRKFRNVCMIRFESYGGSKLDESGPDDPRRPVMVSEGFQRGFQIAGFRFQGLQPFQRVSARFQRGFTVRGFRWFGRLGRG